MQVSAINSNVGFGKQIKKTEKGNEYESTNVAKIVLPSIYAGTALYEKVSGNKISIPIAIFGLAWNTGIGFLLDHFVEKTRQKDADTFAQSGKIEEKTHKGLGIGAAIGACTGVIMPFVTAISISKEIPSIKNKGYLFTIFAIGGAIGGMIEGVLLYDLRVNSSRKKLAAKAEMQEKIAQAVEEKTKNIKTPEVETAKAQSSK